MSWKKSIIAILLALMVSVSLCTFTAYADPEDGDDIPVYSEDDTPIYSEEDTPSYSEEDIPSYSEEDTPIYSEEDTPSYSEEDTPSYSNDDTTSYDSGDTNYDDSYIYPDTDDGVDFDENDEAYSDTKAPTSPVYDVKNKKISTDTLKKSDWEKIKAQLSNADGSDNGDNFNFIRKNNGGDDNGAWMLYLGISLEVIGAATIITVIVLSARKRKKLTAGGSDSDRRTPPSAGNSEKPQREAKDVKQAKKRSKFDTDEIVLPKHVKAESTKPAKSSGKRYKPKH